MLLFGIQHQFFSFITSSVVILQIPLHHRCVLKCETLNTTFSPFISLFDSPCRTGSRTKQALPVTFPDRSIKWCTWTPLASLFLAHFSRLCTWELASLLESRCLLLTQGLYTCEVLWLLVTPMESPGPEVKHFFVRSKLNDEMQFLLQLSDIRYSTGHR